MRRLSGALLATAVLLACGTGSASAATFTVTGAFDTVGPCVGTVCGSLRSAISAANAQAGPDQIVLGPGAYRLERGAATPEDANATGDLDVTDDLTVAGQGAGQTTILVLCPKDRASATSSCWDQPP